MVNRKIHNKCNYNDERIGRNMLIAVIILSIALIVLGLYLLYYKKQISDIGSQLSFIIKHDSFKFVQTQMRPGEIYRLVEQCNLLLSKQRELSNKFIVKNEEVNQTIVSLSHDIRTPLTSLGGYLQLAERTDHLADKSRYLTLALTRKEQIVSLVEQLFFYTKLQNPEYVVELNTLDVIDVLHKRLFTFLDQFCRQNCEPIIHVPDTQVFIIGNHSALDRIFENIIGNYFAHGEGSLVINYEEKHHLVVICFANKVKQDQMIQADKIFTRFYKADYSRTSQSSGLGLSIVKSLMEKMNGSVEVNLEEGEFSITTTFVKVDKERE